MTAIDQLVTLDGAEDGQDALRVPYAAVRIAGASSENDTLDHATVHGGTLRASRADPRPTGVGVHRSEGRYSCGRL